MSAQPLQPEAYEEWRNSPLGALTERVETRLIFRLAGSCAGRRVLDAGCGDGTYAIHAAGRGAQAFGADLSLPMLKSARHRAAAAGRAVRLGQADLNALPFPDCSFDLVFAVTVLCLVPDAGRAVREMARVLRPGGVLVVGELGRYSLWSAVRRIRGWRGAPTWKAARFFSGAELRSLATQARLKVRDLRGAVYYPPVRKILRIVAAWESCLSGRITLGAAFLAISAVKS